MNIYVVALLALTIVMAGMAALQLLVFGIRKLGHGLASTGPAVSAPSEAFDPVLLAVLTAAASEALAAPVHVRRVELRRQPSLEVWSRAGRMDIMISRRLEPRR